MLKLRASWGRVGDDAVVAPWQRFTAGRFLYKDQLSYGGNTVMGSINPDNSPYTPLEKSLPLGSTPECLLGNCRKSATLV